MPGGQIPQLVKRTNPLALVRRVWKAVRQEEDLHGMREWPVTIKETSVQRGAPATWSLSTACGSTGWQLAQTWDSQERNLEDFSARSCIPGIEADPPAYSKQT